ncbi:MAG: 30S ribosomal protein S7 [Candidatus Latescibacteria bacterium]|nr:30S ribosomal protein S7 [Candidatus Latescibacterota bacterium]MCK5379886.1 30S ribosomal protein S7 [Candidatus Latescibacterota bacterium]MCK5526925.1 30S ribosomal protein S7 [Candidatus Latescibacterota bacterium]MCK5734083.1 30S ribosomal protein S7 [Candidatus Latescibacterota bacterium]
MPRRASVSKRPLLPDPKFGNPLVTRFISHLLERGKRSTAELIFYRSIELIEQQTNQKGVEIFEKAVNNVKPLVEVKSRRVGGATYQIPVEIREDRRLSLSIRWLISYARDRAEKTMAERLSAELVAASKNEGNAMKRREDTHRMAEANRAFSHYRW